MGHIDIKLDGLVSFLSPDKDDEEAYAAYVAKMMGVPLVDRSCTKAVDDKIKEQQAKKFNLRKDWDSYKKKRLQVSSQITEYRKNEVEINKVILGTSDEKFKEICQNQLKTVQETLKKLEKEKADFVKGENTYETELKTTEKELKKLDKEKQGIESKLPKEELLKKKKIDKGVDFARFMDRQLLEMVMLKSHVMQLVADDKVGLLEDLVAQIGNTILNPVRTALPHLQLQLERLQKEQEALKDQAGGGTINTTPVPGTSSIEGATPKRNKQPPVTKQVKTSPAPTNKRATRNNPTGTGADDDEAKQPNRKKTKPNSEVGKYLFGFGALAFKIFK